MLFKPKLLEKITLLGEARLFRDSLSKSIHTTSVCKKTIIFNIFSTRKQIELSEETVRSLVDIYIERIEKELEEEMRGVYAEHK